MLGEFKHEWQVQVDPTGEDPALYVQCTYCKAIVEVLVLEAHGQIFLRAQLAGEGAHPVTQQEIDQITKSVYAQFVEPQLGEEQSSSGA